MLILSSLPPNKTLRSAQRDTPSYVISFFLEFDIRWFQLSMRPEPGTNEPFFINLFKGCLLFENLLKNNPAIRVQGNTLRLVLRSLSKVLGLPKKINVSSDNLSRVLIYSEKVDDRIEPAMTVTGKLRNKLGHNLGWPDRLPPSNI